MLKVKQRISDADSIRRLSEQLARHLPNHPEGIAVEISEWKRRQTTRQRAGFEGMLRRASLHFGNGSEQEHVSWREGLLNEFAGLKRERVERGGIMVTKRQSTTELNLEQFSELIDWAKMRLEEYGFWDTDIGK